MVLLVITLSILLAISWGVILLGKKDVLAAKDTSPAFSPTNDAAPPAPVRLENELEKKKKELEEQRSQAAELKEQVKQLKRKVYEQKEAEKDGDDLAKARADVERAASLQLDATRAELAAAMLELEKLKSGGGASKGKKSPAAEAAPKAVAVAAPVAEPVVAAAPSAPAPARVVRELTETERDRLSRLEVLSSKDRVRIAELERDLKNAKGRSETQSRQMKSGRSETKLVTDKFRALEKRLNRTLLERDLLTRALHDIEKKTGVTAERTELTADEVALSDRSIEQMHKAEDKAMADAQAKLEADSAPAAAPAEPLASPTPLPQA